MAGIKGRSGGWNRKSVQELLLSNTFRADRHGSRAKAEAFAAKAERAADRPETAFAALAAEDYEALRSYFLTGAWPAGVDLFLHYATPEAQLAAWWRLVEGRMLPRYVEAYPGCRPWAWWRYSAPRARALGPRWPHIPEWVALITPEPRERLGGTGTPVYEVLNYTPELSCGLPVHYVDAWAADYYNGRARDVHGARIGTEYHEGHFRGVPLDPADPPRYESQAMYLDGHGLFAAGERARVPEAAWTPETVTL